MTFERPLLLAARAGARRPARWRAGVAGAPAAHRRGGALVARRWASWRAAGGAWTPAGAGARRARGGRRDRGAARRAAQRCRPESRALDLVIAVDVSRSMLAEDVAPSRLQRAVREARRLVEDLVGRPARPRSRSPAGATSCRRSRWTAAPRDVPRRARSRHRVARAAPACRPCSAGGRSCSPRRRTAPTGCWWCSPTARRTTRSTTRCRGRDEAGASSGVAPHPRGRGRRRRRRASRSATRPGRWWSTSSTRAARWCAPSGATT